MPVDSSDDEACLAMGTVWPTDFQSATLSGEEDDYQDLGPSGKRKANELATTCSTKKATPFPFSDSNTVTATKGKEWEVNQEMINPQVGKHRAVEILNLDLEDSMDELPEFLTIQGKV